MSNVCRIESFVAGRWRAAARIERHATPTTALDPDLIVRQTRWRSEPGDVDWDDVVRDVSERLPRVLPIDVLAPALRAFGQRLGAAAQLMRDAGVDRDLVTRQEGRIAATSAALCAVRGG